MRVTVLIPARNEERDIERCLAAVAAQTFDQARLQILVVDGASTDATVARARAAFTRFGLADAEVLTNPAGTTPSSLNLGLAHARGEILCRVDARSLIPPDYVARCASRLTGEQEIAVVGGRQVAVPPVDNGVGVGIARALNNRWGMGLSRYRRDAASGPSDTVYLGAFRTADLVAVGGWDERLATNQDFDLNRRLANRGVVFFDAALSVSYVPRSSLGALFRQYRRFGRWKVRYWRLTHDRPRARQLSLMVAPGCVLAGLGLAAARWPHARVPLLAGTAILGAVVEAAGSREPPNASLAAHGCGVLAMGTVAGGWLLGIWEELVHGPRP